MERRQTQRGSYIRKRFHGEGTTQRGDIHGEKSRKKRDYIRNTLSGKETIKKGDYMETGITWGRYYIERGLYRKEIT